jgi:hypothetical protein
MRIALGGAMNERSDLKLTPEAPGDGEPRSASLRVDVVRLVRDKRYEEALELLYQARADAPADRELSASIAQIKEFLVGSCAKRLGGLDRVAGPIPLHAGRSPDALLVARYVDGSATFGDIARTCPLGQLRTLQLLVTLYASQASVPPPPESMPPPYLRALERAETSPPPSAEVPVEPAPPTQPQGASAPAPRFLGTPESAPDRTFRETFARGTAAFVQRRFTDAVEAFQACDRMRPGDQPSSVMLRRALRDLQS